MKTIGRVIFYLIIVCGFAGCKPEKPVSTFPLLSEDLFREPPLEARPGALWPWLNGYVDRKQLVYELEQMKAKGMRGPIIWDIGSLVDPLKMIPTGPAFLGEESLKSIRLAMDECKRLGLDLGMFASSSWNAGGSWIKPENASKSIISSEMALKGPADYKDTLPVPKGMSQYHSEISVYAIPLKSGQSIFKKFDILNISDRYDGKTLIWRVPDGEWKILRFICNNTGQNLVCPSPNSNGLIIDHLSADAAEKHISFMIKTILGDRKDFGALKTFMLDSYEVDPADDWTPGFLMEFQNLFGYNPLPFLPVLSGIIIDNEDVTKRFLHDYHKAVGDMLVTNHFVKEKEILNKNGLKLLAEAGHGGYARVDPLKALGVADIPMGEFWNGSEFWVTKEAASAAHIYGKTLVNAETLTGWRAWKDGPANYKRLFDVALCEGLNQVTFHTFTHNPPEAGLPGFVYHAGEHFNVNSTWWEYAGPMLKYMSRCSYMLQQGQFVGDLCLYFGDQAPNLVPPRRIDPNLTTKYDSTQCWHCGQPKPVDTKGLGKGYDYDYVNEEVVLTKMEYVNGELTLPKDLTYRVMVIPDKTEISLNVLRKLEKLIHAGAVVVGPKPLQSNSLINFPACDKDVKNLGEKIWDDCDGVKVTSHLYGKGKVYYGLPLRTVMTELGIKPDFTAGGFDNSDQHIDYFHRRTQEEDIYFVSNSALNWQKFTARFRIPSGKTPYLWLADDGSIQPCKVLESDNEFTTLELNLPPAGSVFVVFQPRGKVIKTVLGKEIMKLAENQRSDVVSPDKPWKITFPGGRGAPKELMMNDLSDWTLSTIDGVKYFSGTARYSTTFNIPVSLGNNQNDLILDLGDVKEIAVVKINGVTVDTLWKQPYITSVSKFVKPGKNQIDIDVTNLWHNRLVGDAGKEGADRITRTNIQNRYRKKMPLLPSGLIGPVVIR
ncbi:MAG: glycosyl hydrolase [Bacteroidales bacterium]